MKRKGSCMDAIGGKTTSSDGRNDSGDTIQVEFLCQGCQTATDVANRLAGFFHLAQRTLDISIYSFSLCPDAHDIVVNALRERANAGVAIRIAYDAGSQHANLQGLYNDPCDI